MDISLRYKIEELPEVTRAYLDVIMSPYEIYLQRIASYEEVGPLLEEILSEEGQELVSLHPEELQGEVAISEVLINKIRNALLSDLPQLNTVTPWELERAKYFIFNIAGVGTITVPVNVTVGNEEYQHDLTDEFVYGLFVVLTGNKDIQLSINGTPIPPDLLGGLLSEEDNPIFTADTDDASLYFNDTEVVRGIITAADWINQDPHNYIRDIRRWNGREYVLVTF